MQDQSLLSAPSRINIYKTKRVQEHEAADIVLVKKRIQSYDAHIAGFH